MEYGHHGEHLHIGYLLQGKAGGGRGLQCQGVEVQVGEHDALGGAGGAAGIEDGAALVIAVGNGRQGHALAGPDHVVPQCIAGLRQLLHRPGGLGHGVEHIQGDGQLIGDLGNEDGGGVFQLGLNGDHLFIELVQGQNGLALGEVQIEGDLLGGGQGVNHIGNGPDPVQGIEAVQGLGGIGHADGHLVALADAHFVQALGRGVDALHELRIGGLLAHEDIGRVIRILFGGSGHHFIHGLVGILQRSRGISIIFQPGCGCG